MRNKLRRAGILLLLIILLFSFSAGWAWEGDQPEGIEQEEDSGQTQSGAASANAAENQAPQRIPTVLFRDVYEDDWFAETVKTAAARGILSGYPDGSFQPGRQVSYGEFLALCLFADELSDPVRDGHWAMIYYNTAVEKGYSSGSDFTQEDLDSPIPRKHMALLLAAVSENHKIADPGTAPAGNTDLFTDVSADSPCYESIALCAANGLLSGYPDGSFRPDSGLSRCEAAAAIMNYAALLDEKLGNGDTVVQVYDNGNRLLVDPGGQYCVAAGENAIMEVGKPDPNENIHASKLIRSDHKAILDQVLASAKISGSSGNYTFTYTQPQIPSRYHFAVDLHVYQRNSAGGDDPLFFYNSDDGWISDPSGYDPSAHKVDKKVGVKNLPARSIILRLQIADVEDSVKLRLGEYAEYCYAQDSSGNLYLLTVASRYADGQLRTYSDRDPVSDCPAFFW